MEFDWTTFVLEIFNFLVLLWLLERLLYRPVLGVIMQRRSAIEARLADAQRIQQDAERMRADYDERLKAWEAEQHAAREKLHQELREERTRLMEALRVELDQEREKRRVIEEQQLAERTEHAQAIAVDQSVQFLSKLLSRLADASLGSKLAALAVEDLRLLPDSRRATLQAALPPDGAVEITSAHPLPEQTQAELIQSLSAVLGRAPDCRWRHDGRLQAGLRITVGSIVLHANLEDELRFFAERAPYDASRFGA